MIQIMRLHIDAVKIFDVVREPGADDDWTEEDDAAIADIIKEIDEMEGTEEDPGEDESEEGDGT